VIGVDKKMIGILPIKEAMRMAAAQGYDLVEVAPKADPPVCRILDYGKFLYEEKAKQQAAKKHQHTVSVRQIRLTLKISQHDFDTKIRKMREFLEAKDRVKVTLRLRGREVVHKDQGVGMIDRILERVSDIAALEEKPSLEGTTRLSWQAMFVPTRTSSKTVKRKQEDKDDASDASEEALSTVSEEGKVEEG
jgi:translation initiation factor IF-3